MDPYAEPGAGGVELKDAIEQMRGPVFLPTSEQSGDVVKVLFWPEPAGKRNSMGIRYASGLSVVVQPKMDLNARFKKLSGTRYQFTDDKQHVTAEESPAPELAASTGVEAYSVAAGKQILKDGGTNNVHSLLLFNRGGFTYKLSSKDDVLSMDQLRAVMKSFRPAP